MGPIGEFDAKTIHYGTLYRRVLLVGPILPDFDTPPAFDAIPATVVRADFSITTTSRRATTERKWYRTRLVI